jgi:hypothetical protein
MGWKSNCTSFRSVHYKCSTNEMRFAGCKTQNASCSGVAIMYTGAVTRHWMCAVWRTVLTLSICNVHCANSYSCSFIPCKVCSCIPQVWEIKQLSNPDNHLGTRCTILCRHYNDQFSFCPWLNRTLIRAGRTPRQYSWTKRPLGVARFKTPFKEF